MIYPVHSVKEYADRALTCTVSVPLYQLTIIYNRILDRVCSEMSDTNQRDTHLVTRRTAIKSIAGVAGIGVGLLRFQAGPLR